MPPLPQSRKSAEEIARLREQLGVGEVAPAPQAVAKPDAASAPQEDVVPDAVVVPHIDDDIPIAAPQSKYVRTLRKSQAGWTYVATPPQESESWLPNKRRGVKSLEALRTHHAINLQPPEQLPHFIVQCANRWQIIAGYLLALGGPAAAVFGQAFTPAAYAAVALALPVPVWIFLRKKYSRHHAAFMFTLTVLVLFFGFLYLKNPHAA